MFWVLTWECNRDTLRIMPHSMRVEYPGKQVKPEIGPASTLI